MQRRSFLKGTLGASAVAVAVSAGLLDPRQAMAAVSGWPKAAFTAGSAQSAIKDLFGSAMTKASADITIKAPDIAENGAVVPVTITTRLAGVESIGIVIEKNPNPLAANFNLSPQGKGFISTRVKMRKTSNVIAVVKAGGKIYSARRQVKVTIGGCGG